VERGDWAALLELIGERDGDVPLAPFGNAEARALRAVALERSDRSVDAEAEMSALAIELRETPELLRSTLSGRLAVGRRIWARFDPAEATGLGEALRKAQNGVAGAGLLLIIAAVLVVLAIKTASDVASDEQWKPAGAIVEAATTAPNERRSIWNTDREEVVLEARYRYEVDGRHYAGSHWQRDQEHEPFHPGAVLDERVKTLRENPSITVFYDPGNPAQSFRERRTTGALYPMVGTAVVLGLVAIGLVVGWVRTRRRVREAAASLSD